MRALVSLFFIFGSVAVVYAIHWSRRTASTVRDASTTLRETGSFGATINKMALQQAVPSELRISRTQEDFLNHHWVDFRERYGTNILKDTDSAMAQWLQQREHVATDLETERQTELYLAVFHARYGKIYCETKGIY